MSDYLRSNIKKYYLAYALNGLSLTIPITVLYYLSFGLSYAQVALLESIFLVTLLVFEIPTGALADRFGRKTTITLGALIMPIATFITALSSSFLAFAIICIMYGIGMALMSGAENALIYDSLVSAEEEKTFIKVEGRTWALFYLFAAISAPFGSYIFAINKHIPFYFDAAILFVVFLIYASMHEPKSKSLDENKPRFVETLIEGIKQVSRNSIVKWYVALGVLLSISMTAFYNVIGQPLLVNQGVEVKHIGYVIAAVMLVQAISAENAHKIEKKLGEQLSLALLFLIPSISFMVMGTQALFLVVSFYILYGASKGLCAPLLQNCLNKNLSSSSRATALSFESFLGGICGAIFLPLVGLTVDNLGIGLGVLLLGMFLLASGLVLQLFKPVKFSTESTREMISASH